MKRKTGSLSTKPAARIHQLFTEDIGRKHEDLAFDLVTKSVRDILKKEGIEYLVDYTFWFTQGKDLKVEFIKPIKFVLFVEIKSRKKEADSHRKKAKYKAAYRNPVVIVNERRSRERMINRFANIFRQKIREQRTLTT